MIKYLKLHNFRTFLNAEIEFARRHLVIGKNNSGKTNLCSAMRFLGRAAGEPLSQAAGSSVPGGIAEMTNWSYASNRIDFVVACELPFGQDSLSYEYTLSLEVTSSLAAPAPGALGLRVVVERLVVDGGGLKGASLLENDGQKVRLRDEEHASETSGLETPTPQDATMLSQLHELQTNRRAILFRRFLASWFYFCLSPVRIRFGWREASQATGLWADGASTATAIFHLKNQDERRYRRLIERVKVVEEDLDSVNFYVGPDQGILPFVSLGRRRQASWAGLSDGTLRALALSYIIEAADQAADVAGWPPPFVMIEEPENGVYAGLLRKLLEGFEECAPLAQFVFTSHSPYFIDLFDSEPSSVTLLRRERERTVVQRLAASKTPLPPDERTTLAERYFAEILG